MQDELQQASLDGIVFDIENIEDAFENSLVKNEYPFRNGADLQALGLSARTITFRAYFYGDNYSAHKQLLENLKVANVKRTLVHPIYGILTGDIEKAGCRHDDRKQTAELNITFVENQLSSTEPQVKESVTSAATAAAVKGATGRFQWMKSVLNQAQKTYAAAKAKAVAFENKLAEAQGQFDNLMTSVSNPAASFTTLLTFAESTPANLVQAAARGVERYAVAYQTLKSAPANFMRQLDDSFRALEQAFSSFGSSDPVQASAATAAQAVLRLSCAEALGLAAADVFSQDQELRDSYAAMEGAASTGANGEFAPAELSSAGNQAEDTASRVSTLMTMADLEASLALTRSYLQAAVDTARENNLDPQPYKDLALALETHVNSIKLEREQVMQVHVQGPQPLHVVCLRYGLPYRAAARILALNSGLQNPNKTAGELNIYAGGSND